MVPAETLVHHFVRASSRSRTQHRGTRTRTRNDLISPQVTSNLFGRRSASPKFKQPIEYEYRFTEYRFAEYEYDEIRCEARKTR